MHPDYFVRLARPGDIPSLARIEREAAAQFRGLGFEGAYLDEVCAPALLAEAQREGSLWIAERGGECVGFLVAGVLDDGEAWIEEVDVHPGHGRRGVGRALVEAAIEWARQRGAPSIGLTTFREVAWNAPFYATLGFREVTEADWSPAIRNIVAGEKSRGLPPEKRLAMRRDLDGPPAGQH